MQVRSGFTDAIGNTPLIRLNRISDATGCEILGKAEFMNPGGSVKDRAALYMIDDAERSGRLQPGGTVVEGTAGNTGIGIAHICNARGYRCVIFMPDNQSQEKVNILRTLGATVHVVPTVPYRDDMNYQKQAGRHAETLTNAIWANQFDNVANRAAHYAGTGPELWAQTDGRISAFVAAVGTGGTLAGTSRFLKEKKPSVRIVLADPPGSALHNYISRGVAEMSPGSSITEGIGNSRVTLNLEGSPIDEAIEVPDQYTLDMVHGLLRSEGLFLGASSGCNVAAAHMLAKRYGPGQVIVTLLCDGGQKYLSRLYQDDWLRSRGLTPPGSV